MNLLVTHKNRIIRVAHEPILSEALQETELTANIASGSSTLTVANIEKFAVGKFVWIDPFTEKGEIIAVHASSAPSGSTITLASNTSFAHSAGAKVLYVEFNQAEFNHAATLGGSKSVLATVALAGGERETRYLDTSQTTGFYFVRLKDSVAGTFSGYSDGIEYGGRDANTVGYMIENALRDANETLSEIVTLDDCLQWLTKGMTEIKGKLKNWPEHMSYNTIIGQTSRGTNVVTMPTDAYDTETGKSILGLRVGTGKNLNYLDPVAFDIQTEHKVTQVRTQATSGSTTLEIDNSYDFEDSGTVHVYISGTQYAITYTGVTRSSSAGVLTGIPASGDGSISVTVPVDTYVWQDEAEGEPVWFTVRNGAIEYSPLVDSEHDNANIYADYAKVCTAVDSEGDTIDYQRYDMLQNYLTWRIRAKAKNNGTLDFNDGYYITFKELLNDAIRTLPNITKSRWSPNINTMSTRRVHTRPDIQDISVDDQ